MTSAFLVGPSGAGKSELLRLMIPRIPGARLLDLDGVDRSERTESWGDHWEERRWTRDLARLGAAEGFSDLIVVDVGAGSLQTAPGRSYFLERRARCIAIIADPKVVYSRKHLHRRYEEFLSTEFGAERREVYDCAAATIDTSESNVAKNAEQLVQSILELGTDGRK